MDQYESYDYFRGMSPGKNAFLDAYSFIKHSLLIPPWEGGERRWESSNEDFYLECERIEMELSK